MAVPSLPSDMSAGNTFTAARVNAIYDLLEWFRDSRPLLKTGSAASTSIASGTNTQWGFSDGSGSWVSTPSRNVGGWAPSATTERIVVPETGLYLITVETVFAAPTASTTRLQFSATDGTAAIPGIRNWIHESQANAGSSFILNASGTQSFTSGDELGVQVFHDNGSGLAAQVRLSAVWMQA